MCFKFLHVNIFPKGNKYSNGEYPYDMYSMINHFQQYMKMLLASCLSQLFHKNKNLTCIPQHIEIELTNSFVGNFVIKITSNNFFLKKIK